MSSVTRVVDVENLTRKFGDLIAVEVKTRMLLEKVLAQRAIEFRKLLSSRRHARSSYKELRKNSEAVTK